MPGNQRGVGEHAQYRRSLAGGDRVNCTLDHRDRGGALDLDVLKQAQVGKSVVCGEPDAEPIRAHPLR